MGLSFDFRVHPMTLSHLYCWAISHAMRTFAYLTLLLTLASSHAYASTQVVITTRPRFADRGQFTYLLLADAKQRYEVAWAMPPKMQFLPVVLDTNRVYTFTLHEKPYRDITIPELLRVQADGQTIYDVAVCEVHKTKMELKEVRISYGLPAPSMLPTDTERRLFPHYREQVLGGCVMSPDSPKAEKIYVCSECKNGYEKWKGENARTK